DLDQPKTGRSLDAGRKAFGDTGCGQCHRFEGQGGTVGPDLAGVGRRLKAREVLESILLPSKVIADGYADTVVETAGGAVITGRIEREDDRVLVLRPPSGEAVTVPKKEIVDRRKSDVSNMPPGTVNVLQKDQVLDLVGTCSATPCPRRRRNERAAFLLNLAAASVRSDSFFVCAFFGVGAGERIGT